MKLDRKAFFERYRNYFPATLTQEQVNGFEAMFDYWEDLNLTDRRWLAYILATAYHETGTLMQPVREGFCQTDAGSINAVATLFNLGDQENPSVNYALPDPVTGQSYFGRGLVQLTWADNYKTMGNSLGIGMQLYENPALALDLAMSVKILFKGMIEGLFSAAALPDFFNGTVTDWIGARKIVNGSDQAPLIAGYAQDFLACM
jgi:Chitinase class I